jgi:subfamily B ATP-binding cassette protein MsbA
VTAAHKASKRSRRAASALLQAETRGLLLRMWRDWMRPHWPALATILVLVGVLAGASSLYPVVIKSAFDAFEQQNKRLVQLIPFIVIVVTAVKGGAMWAQAVLTNRVVTRIEADMQSALYGHLIEADLARLSRETPAALTQRFTTDFTYVREGLTRLSTVFLRDVATAVALVCVMLWIDWEVALAALVVLPIVAPAISSLGRKLRRTAHSTQEQTGIMAGMVTESLAGVRVAKAYGMEGRLKERAARTFEEIRRLKMKAANQRARLDPLLEVAGGLAVAGVLVFIGWRIVKGQTTIGDFTGFVTALLLAAQSMRALGNLSAVLQEAAAALARFYAVIDETPTVLDRPGAPPIAISAGEIAFRHVSFAYGGGSAALSEVELVVPGGRMTALVGRSGSGKSTLMSLVPRLFDPTGGVVAIDGQDLRAVTLESLRRKVAMVSQDVVLFDDTVAANIAIGRPGASREEIADAARAAAAHDFIARLPQGYDTPVGDRGMRLSGGERQRVSLARAILKDAPILLLDEATSALDSESERIVQDALTRLARGRTSLVIAHRLSTVRAADLIVVLDDGRVAESGSHDELLARGGIYAKLHRLQSGADGTEPDLADGLGLIRA